MNWLFDYGSFMTRSHCGPGWSAALIFVYQVANLMIAVAYFCIPLSLLVFWSKKKGTIPHPWIIVLFASFIGFCGLTHVSDIVVFYFPMYRFFCLLLLITGIISLITAVALPGVVGSQMLTVSEEISKLRVDLEHEKQQRIKIADLLKLSQQQNDILTQQIKTKLWRDQA